MITSGPIGLGVAIAIAAWLVHWLWDFITNPLRNVPGPLLARFSRLWLIRIDASGQRSKTIHELHKTYGSVVRIGPDELSFSSRQAMRDIYGVSSKLIKAPVYEAFGRQSSFTIRNKAVHQARQKRVAHVFAPVAITAVEPLVHDEVGKLLNVLLRRVGEPIDVMEWFRIFALDVVGSVFLGKSFGGLEEEKSPRILHELDEVFPSLWAEWQFSSLRPLLLAIPSKPLNRFLKIGPEFYDYGRDAFNDYVAQHGRSGDRRDLLTKLIAGSKDYAPLEDDEIINEMTNLIFAGTDTTSNTFSYLLYELAQHPEFQAMLHSELDQVPFTHVPEYKDVTKLPVLDALIQETLRFHPAAPASLQRISPKEGQVVIDGVPIPGNAIVSCQSYTTQRDPKVYPDPDTFTPTRWLVADEGQLNLMHEHILVWGKGSRSCLGKQLAYMELKVGMAALMKKFRVEIGSNTTHDDMEMTDHFTLIAKGQRCILKLLSRD